MMKQLYEQCTLVHADLSEYNMMWHDGKVSVFCLVARSEDGEMIKMYILTFIISLNPFCMNIWFRIQVLEELLTLYASVKPFFQSCF